MNTAVILAAGIGSRLSKDYKCKIPKGFVKIGKTTLIEKSVNNLLKIGINKIIIGVGFLSNYYENFAQKYSEIICVKNNDYSTTGSMHTLYSLKNYINDDFILLESDLLYDIKLLKELNCSSYKNIILTSPISNYGDDVFIETDAEQNLVNLSKDINILKKTDCELIGISKISLSLFKCMCEEYYQNKKNMRLYSYEDIIAKISSKNKIYCKNTNEIWCEIDTVKDYERALNEISPKIKEE